MTRRAMPTAFNSIFNSNDSVPIPNGPTQASNSRACTNCVRAKAKCSTRINSRKCERCDRMNKDCQPSPPMRKRRTGSKRASSKTSKLEEKVDGLVTLLKSATQGVPGIVNSISIDSPPEDFVPSNHKSSSGSPATGSAIYGDYTYNRPLLDGQGLPESEFTPAASSHSGSSLGNLPPVLDPTLEPCPEDAESYLDIFRQYFVKHLPFIAISHSMTAHQLRQERPCLWICIMTVASTNTTQQIRLSKEVRGIFGREAFVEGTRNMDLLLAVLVYAIWDHRHCLERSIYTSLVQFAIAILYDLGLDKPPSKDPALVLAYDLKGVKKPSRLSRSPTLEERRALLGCFLLSSLSSYLRTGETLRWTAYADECLRVIETQKEFESDELLVQLVKLRLISEKVVNSPWSGVMVESDSSINIPAMFYLKSLEAQLHDFKSNIPGELANNEVLLMELYNTELTVYDVGLSQTPDIFIGQYNRRLECLYAFLNAAKCWIDIFLEILPAQYVGFSMLTYAGLTRCFMGFYRLSIFEHPEWDREMVRGTMDVSVFLDETEKKFAQVKEAAGIDVGGSSDVDCFTVLASKIRLLKMWDAIPASSMEPFGTAVGEEMADFSMLLDDDWLSYLFSPWNK